MTYFKTTAIESVFLGAPLILSADTVNLFWSHGVSMSDILFLEACFVPRRTRINLLNNLIEGKLQFIMFAALKYLYNFSRL